MISYHDYLSNSKLCLLDMDRPRNDNINDSPQRDAGSPHNTSHIHVAGQSLSHARPIQVMGEEQRHNYIGASDAGFIEHAPVPRDTPYSLTTTPLQTSSSSQGSHPESSMDIDPQQPRSLRPTLGTTNNDADDGMPSLLDESDWDSDGPDAHSVEMMFVGSEDTGRELFLAEMPALGRRQRERSQTRRQHMVQTPQGFFSETLRTRSEPSRNRRRVTVEDDVEVTENIPVNITPRFQTDSDPVRVGTRRARVEDEVDAVEETMNALPGNSTPLASGSITPDNPERPMRRLPRNGPLPPYSTLPNSNPLFGTPGGTGNGTPAFDAGTFFQRMFATLRGRHARQSTQTPSREQEHPVGNANIPSAPSASGATNATTPPAHPATLPHTQGSAQPVPFNIPETSSSSPNIANNPSGPTASNGTQQNRPQAFVDIFYDVFDIGSDGRIPGVNSAPQTPFLPPDHNLGLHDQPGQRPEPMQPLFGQPAQNFIEALRSMVFTNGAFMNLPRELQSDNPERAARLVDGLEVVSHGLVKRMERVGGAPGIHEDAVGGPGCAVCWDGLLDTDGDESKEQDVSTNTVSGNTGDASRESSVSAQSASVLGTSNSLP